MSAGPAARPTPTRAAGCPPRSGWSWLHVSLAPLPTGACCSDPAAPLTGAGRPHKEKAVKSIRIVIVNYRTAGLVVDCLRSLVEEVRGLGDCRAVVVDNDSGDGSAGRIPAANAPEGWGARAVLLPPGPNPAFPGGTNSPLRPPLPRPTPPRSLPP